MPDQKHEKRIRALLKAYENYMLEVLVDGIAAKVFRDVLDPRVVVAGIMGVGNSIYKGFSPTGPLTFQAIADTYIELFISGLKSERQNSFAA